MTKFEYIRLILDLSDLTELNHLGSVGWHVVGVMQEKRAHQDGSDSFLLLERPLPPGSKQSWPYE